MKKLKVFLGLLVCAFMVVPFMGVSAIDADGIGYDGSNVTSEQREGVYYLTLTGDATLDLVIDGEEVVLDLNGHNFTNFADANSVIYVKSGKLTITDSQNSGTIKKKDSSAAPTVNNEGTLIVEGGTISSKGEKSAALHNSGTLTVAGGTITTEEDNVFGLVNEGTTVIDGGNFIQAHNFSALNNANKMEIKNGNFTISDGNTGAYSLITNQGSTNNASLEITGGTFKANGGVFYNEGEDEIAISGGSYSHDVSAYLADGFEMKEENGEFVLVENTTPETPKDDTEVKDEVENPKTSDGIMITVAALVLSSVIVFVARKKLS